MGTAWRSSIVVGRARGGDGLWTLGTDVASHVHGSLVVSESPAVVASSGALRGVRPSSAAWSAATHII